MPRIPRAREFRRSSGNVCRHIALFSVLPFLSSCVTTTVSTTETRSGAVVSRENVRSLAPVNIVTNVDQEVKIVGLRDRFDNPIMALAFQGGLVGGTVGMIITSAFAPDAKEEFVMQLGNAYGVIESADKYAIITDGIRSNPALDSLFKGRMLHVAKWDRRSLAAAQQVDDGGVLTLDSTIIFTSAVDSLVLATSYALYETPANSGEATKICAGNVFQVYFPGYGTEERAADVNGIDAVLLYSPQILKALSSGLLDDVLFDMRNPASSGTSAETYSLMGYEGAIMGMANGRLYLRGKNGATYALPLPPVVNMDVRKVAVLRNKYDEVSCAEVIKAELERRGLEARIMEELTDAKEDEIVLRYGVSKAKPFFREIIGQVYINLQTSRGERPLGKGIRTASYELGDLDKAVRAVVEEAFADRLKAPNKKRSLAMPDIVK